MMNFDLIELNLLDINSLKKVEKTPLFLISIQKRDYLINQKIENENSLEIEKYKEEVETFSKKKENPSFYDSMENPIFVNKLSLEKKKHLQKVYFHKNLREITKEIKSVVFKNLKINMAIIFQSYQERFIEKFANSLNPNLSLDYREREAVIFFTKQELFVYKKIERKLSLNKTLSIHELELILNLSLLISQFLCEIYSEQILENAERYNRTLKKVLENKEVKQRTLNHLFVILKFLTGWISKEEKIFDEMLDIKILKIRLDAIRTDWEINVPVLDRNLEIRKSLTSQTFKYIKEINTNVLKIKAVLKQLELYQNPANLNFCLKLNSFINNMKGKIEEVKEIYNSLSREN